MIHSIVMHSIMMQPIKIRSITLLPIHLFLLLLLVLPLQAQAKKVAGFDIPETLSHADTSLVLNGAGVRKRLVVTVYVGALYLQEKSQDAAAIIAADAPMAIRLQVKSGLLSREKMQAALTTGFKKATNDNTAPIQNEIDQMLALMSDKISKKDVYVLAYDPVSGTTMSKNGTPMGSVAGLAFKQALFGIWLSDKPAQASLKKRMLGQ